MAAMVGCVAVSVGDLVRLFVPDWNGAFLLIGGVLAALEAPYAFRLIQARRISGVDVWRFRALEYAFIFLALKFGRFAGQTAPAVLAEAQGWMREPLTFFDFETTLTFLLVGLFSFAVTESLQDFERLGQPPEMSKGEVPPVESLTRRFFWGGGLLLIISGLARLGLAALLDLERPPMPGLVLNVLIYFMLGLVMMGQINFDRLHNLWRMEGVPVAGDLGRRWARYSLTLLGMAALLAFALPTAYTLGALGFIGDGLYLVFYALMFVLGLLLWPFILLLAALLSLLGLRATAIPRSPPPLPLDQPQLFSPGAAWSEILRTLLVVAILVGMTVYIVVSFLHDRPELINALRRFGPFRALRRWWAGLRARTRVWARAASDALPRAWLRRWLRRASPTVALGFFRLGGASPREQILYYYLSIVRRAGEHGLPRRSAQTPAEYRATLVARLPEAQEAVGALTGAFVEARYSAHPLTSDHAERVRSVWKRVRAALQALRQQRKG
jgi:hypothetical protein